MVHTPLDPHLHTDKCNQIITALKKCHAEESLSKQLFGACNQLDHAMRMCTRGERLERTRKKLDNSKVNKEETQKKIQQATKEGKTWRDVMRERAEKQE